MTAALALGGVLLGALLTWLASAQGQRAEHKREHVRWLRGQRFEAWVEMQNVVARQLNAVLLHPSEALLQQGILVDAHVTLGTIRMLGPKAIHRPTFDVVKAIVAMTSVKSAHAADYEAETAALTQANVGFMEAVAALLESAEE